MACDHCETEEEFQIIIENPTKCTFVCKFHKNKITKQLRESGIPYTLNKVEVCYCGEIEGEHYCTSAIG